MENSAWSVLEGVSLSDGQCLFVLCVKRSVSVSVCWAVCHLMTVFLCVCVSAWLSCCHWAPLCLCVPVVSLILWVCVSMCDSSVGKESACNAEDPSSIPVSGRSAGERISYPLQYSWASPVGQLVKNPPTIRETWVQSLGWEDPLEKGKAVHSSILAWRIPWTI